MRDCMFVHIYACILSLSLSLSIYLPLSIYIFHGTASCNCKTGNSKVHRQANRLETQAGVSTVVLKQNSFFSGNLHFCS